MYIHTQLLRDEYLDIQTYFTTFSGSKTLICIYIPMKKTLLFLLCATALICGAHAGTSNIAPQARATASSSLRADTGASKVNDGLIRLDNAGEWVSAAEMPYWQQLPFPWIQLDWDEEVTLSRIILYDRPTADAHTAGGDLYFSDGTRIGVVGIPDNGAPKVVEFAPKREIGRAHV